MLASICLGFSCRYKCVCPTDLSGNALCTVWCTRGQNLAAEESDYGDGCRRLPFMNFRCFTFLSLDCLPFVLPQ